VNEIEALLSGELPALVVQGCAVQASGSPERRLFPGAFAPWHEGHRRIAEIAARQLHSPVAYEISVLNVDKPPLLAADVVARLRQFPAADRIWLTRAATFVEKAELFPGTTFLVGVDTLLRIADPHYCRGSVAERDAAIRRLAEADCRFLVFGRLVERRFRVLSDLELPAGLRSLCDEVTEQEFRLDISSTESRSR
jgi:hypothetical protein